MATNFCPYCGEHIFKGALFCANCGRQIPQNVAETERIEMVQAAPKGIAESAVDTNENNTFAYHHRATSSDSQDAGVTKLKPSRFDNLKRDYFSSVGRISGGTYFNRRIGLLVLCGVAVGMVAGGMSVFGKGSMGVMLFLGSVMIVALVVACVMQDIKRFHDLNMPGIWALIVPIINSIIGAFANSAVLSTVIAVAYFIWLTMKSGYVGENDYGLPPDD